MYGRGEAVEGLEGLELAREECRSGGKSISREEEENRLLNDELGDRDELNS